MCKQKRSIALTDKSLLASSIAAEILVPLGFENDNRKTTSYRKSHSNLHNVVLQTGLRNHRCSCFGCSCSFHCFGRDFLCNGPPLLKIMEN